MNRVNIDAVIDSAPFRGLPRMIACCALAILVLEGLDIQLISRVAPVLIQDFSIDRSALGPVLTAALIGTALFSVTTLCAASYASTWPLRRGS